MRKVRERLSENHLFSYMQHVNHIRFDSNECTAHLRLALNKQPAHELRKQVPEEMINAANGNECRKWNFRCLFGANGGTVFLLLSLSTSGFVWFVYGRVRCMHDMHWKIPFTCRTGIAANLSSFCVRCFSYMNLNTQRIHNFERLVHGFGYISYFVCVCVSDVPNEINTIVHDLATACSRNCVCQILPTSFMCWMLLPFFRWFRIGYNESLI